MRERFNLQGSSLDFLFLNRSCFNGVMRFNRHGRFNVPFGQVLQDGRLKSQDAIAAAFKQAGVDLDKPVITSCGRKLNRRPGGTLDLHVVPFCAVTFSCHFPHPGERLPCRAFATACSWRFY